jgi:hypothetical protein
MSKLKDYKDQAESFLLAHEQALTVTLLVVACLLILIALAGKPHHKAAACLYIVL